MTTNQVEQVVIMSEVQKVEAEKVELDEKLQTIALKIAEIENEAKSQNILTVQHAGYPEAAQEYMDVQSRLSKIAERMISARLVDNREKIHEAELSCIAAVKELSKALNLEELLGKPLERLVYLKGRPESAAGANDAVADSVSFNPQTSLKPVVARTKSGEGAVSKGGQTMYVKGDEKLNGSDLVRRYGTPEELAGMTADGKPGINPATGKTNWFHTKASKVAEREGFAKVVIVEN